MNIAPPPPQLSIFRNPWLQWCLWYCINFFVQMTKIFFNWLMRLVDWFHWHFCIVVRLRVLTSFESNFKKSAFCSNMILAETWPSCLYLITWFVGLLLKIALKYLLADWKCLWSMFGIWFLNTCVNHAILTQAYLAHAQRNFPAARKCMIEIEPPSEEQ